jgi:hypothetical protein
VKDAASVIALERFNNYLVMVVVVVVVVVVALDTQLWYLDGKTKT